MTNRWVFSVFITLIFHAVVFFTPLIERTRINQLALSNISVVTVKLKDKNIKPKKKNGKHKASRKKVVIENKVSKSNIEHKTKTKTKTKALYKIVPEYPYHSRLNQEEGTVTVKFRLGKAGKAVDILITSSSGHERLDLSCIKAIEKAHFSTMVKQGETIGPEISLTFNFSLRQK